jgi:hypothetical protein
MGMVELDHRADQVALAHRNFLISPIYDLSKAKAVEHSSHRLRLNYVFEVAARQ